MPPDAPKWCRYGTWLVSLGESKGNAMSEELPELTPKTFEAFMERLRGDASLKADVIRGIEATGFVAVLEQFFELSARQKEQLEPLRAGRGAARHWEHWLTTALITDGNISIVHEARESFDLELHGHIPGTDIAVDVSIHC